MHTSDHPERPPSPPTITRVHSPTVSIPTPGLLLSVAEGAHYSGLPRHSKSERRRASFGPGISEASLSRARRQVIEDVKELFSGHPSVKIFERSWRRDAVFEDPWSKCIGYREYAAQWFALPKLCSKSERLSFRVLSSTTQPNQIIYAQRQQYTMRLFGTKKIVESLVIIDLDENDKILKLEDKWNGEDQPKRWGAELLRRFNAKATKLLVSVKPLKDKTT
ncbi:hypothetical protein M422DRAFT_30497 [Sphaerobolus stellatus SS14]|uniref:Uncharacterized protein n=1 Tax=Sphaerobolus stellatus (strain SS14) TaxID=990650 RepID=A0A0C9VBL9_SPHS4|nr:hypothetical protein M422DRAFT_30497 [Sphaerobolus stellatus SS14]